MPTTTFNGVVTPVGSDPYALTADLLRMAKSMNLTIPVASEAERDGLAGLSGGPLPAGFSVTRSDLNGLQQTWNGNAWVSPSGIEMIEVSAPDGNWLYRVRLTRFTEAAGTKKQIFMSLLMIRQAGTGFTIEALNWRTLITGLIPSGWRPGLRTPGSGIVTGPSFGGIALEVATDGALLTRSTGGDTPVSNGTYVNGTLGWIQG